MDRQQEMVAEFHGAFGHPIAEVPHLIDMELAKNRAKWTKDEIEREFLEAIGDYDIVGAYDALIDGLYFIYGTAVAMGLDLEPGFLVVHRANMAKLGPNGEKIVDADGKVQKPEGWVPPEELLIPIVTKQMEDGRIYTLAKAAAEAYINGEEIALPKLTPGDIVKVTQAISILLRMTNPDAHERWAEEFGS